MKDKLLTPLHLIVVIVTYTAFVWADWRLVFAGILVYWLQIIIFKSCVISIAQYNNKEISFVGVYINRLIVFLGGQEISMKILRNFLNWILPIIFLLSAYVLQVIFKVEPVLRLK